MKPCPICSSSRVRHERTLNGIALLRCGRCAFVYAGLPDGVIEAENRAVFDAAATEVYEARQTALDEAWFERIAARLTRGVGSGSVLDVGCGNGLLLARFQARGWSAHGVDFSSWAEPFARRHGYVLHRATLEGAGLPEGSFDVVTSTSTLEHVAHPYEHVREILRVLKPGGLAYFAGMPNYGSLAVRLRVSAFAHNLPPRHVNYFTRTSLRRLLAMPEIAPRIRRVRVSTYGVPELHALLEQLTRRLRRRGMGAPTRDDGSGPPADLPPAGGATRRRARGDLRIALRSRAVEVHYRLGRLLYLGDKLEVLIRKRN